MLGRIAWALGGQLDGRVTAFASAARMMTLPSGESLDIRALETINPNDVAGAHVIHLAYLTKEKADPHDAGAFDAANEAIDAALLGAIQRAAPASLFVASSGAAALALGGDDHPYGQAKLRQERRFLTWSAASHVPTIAGRIFALSGPYINKLRSYALSDFALQARETGEIRVTASVPIFRSYLHVEDLCDLVIGAARLGIGRSEPIDLCGAEVVEIGDLARLVAGNDLPIRRGPVDFARSSAYLGDPTQAKVLAMELACTLRPLTVQVSDTVAWLAASSPPGQVRSFKPCSVVSSTEGPVGEVAWRSSLENETH